MSQITYQNSSAPELIEFARQNGVDLPDDTSKQDAWKAVKNILADFNELPADDQEEQAAAPVSVVKGKQPTHYTIQVSRPTDVLSERRNTIVSATSRGVPFLPNG